MLPSYSETMACSTSRPSSIPTMGNTLSFAALLRHLWHCVEFRSHSSTQTLQPTIVLQHLANIGSLRKSTTQHGYHLL